MPTLAENLRRIRKEKGLSQVDLAKRAKVAQQLISQIENGKVDSTKELSKLANALSVPASDLDERFKFAPEAEKIPQEVREAFEQIPGAPLSEAEAQLVIAQLRLIALSRIPRNENSPGSELPRAS